MNSSTSTSYCQKHQRGIALIEALIATGVLVGGMAAALGIHSMVVGNSAQNRLNSVAMSAAQAKIEELRSQEYSSLDNGNDTWPRDGERGFVVPGIGNSSTLVLTRCWTVESAADTSTLARVRVSVVRSGTDCDASNASGALAHMDTLVAQQDPRVAAVSLADQRRADGEARLVQQYEVGDRPTTPTTGGFELVYDKGELVAIYNPSTGDALLPLSGRDLRVSLISGNILIEGAPSTTDLSRITVSAEANAFCRVYHPRTDAPPSISNSVTLTYIQYTCVVANQWRRAIIVGAPNYKVCVGDPDSSFTSQPSEPPNTNNYIGADVFASRARFYSGYGYRRDLDGTIVGESPIGVRGSRDDASFLSKIGSVCEDGPCQDNTALHGWVPGGHHFFLMNAEENRYCIEAMHDTFLDLEEGDAQIRGFGNILWGNPHRRYCTNEKGFHPEEFEDDASKYCRSSTGFSGFLLPTASASDLDTGTVISSITGSPGESVSNPATYSPPVSSGCATIGPLGETGGAYSCYFEDAGVGARTLTVTPRSTNADVTFFPTSRTESSGDYPHDITNQDFNYSN